MNFQRKKKITFWNMIPQYNTIRQENIYPSLSNHGELMIIYKFLQKNRCHQKV